MCANEPNPDRNDYITAWKSSGASIWNLTESLNFDHVLQIALNAALRISQASAGAIHVLENDKLRVVHVVGQLPVLNGGHNVSLNKASWARVADVLSPN